jgi:TonB family protein
MRLALRSLALSAAAALACSGTARPPATAAGGPEPGRGALEDATPAYWDERDVDVPARPVDPIRPVYPPELRALGLEGDVEARVAVSADGSVGGAQLVTSSDEAFTAAARAALRDARFHPARRAGQPVPSWVTVRLYFRLEE